MFHSLFMKLRAAHRLRVQKNLSAFDQIFLVDGSKVLIQVAKIRNPA
jgi:hypothetical protein